jgi:hypothetical protein
LILMAPAWAAAQQPDNSAPAALRSSPTPTETGPDAGTKPGGIGSTGWTGARRDTQVEISKQNMSEAAANQPEMATGVDLKGPPKRFQANQTPE